MCSALHLRQRRFPAGIGTQRNQVVVSIENVDSGVAVLRHLVEDRERLVAFAEVRVGAHEVDIERRTRHVMELRGLRIRLHGAAVIAGGVLFLTELKKFLLRERRRRDKEKKECLSHPPSLESRAIAD